MGANTSALSSEEIEEISRQACLSQDEVKRLYIRFQKLDRSQSGALQGDDLLMIPELAMNPLQPRLLALFENVNFHQFVTNLGAFSPTAPPTAKAEFAFRIYDVDGDGFISEDDLNKVLRMLVGNNIPEDTLRAIVSKVITDADTDGDGKIARHEFTETLNLADIAKRLTVSF